MNGILGLILHLIPRLVRCIVLPLVPPLIPPLVPRVSVSVVIIHLMGRALDAPTTKKMVTGAAATRRGVDRWSMGAAAGSGGG